MLALILSILSVYVTADFASFAKIDSLYTLHRSDYYWLRTERKTCNNYSSSRQIVRNSRNVNEMARPCYSFNIIGFYFIEGLPLVVFSNSTGLLYKEICHCWTLKREVEILLFQLTRLFSFISFLRNLKN